MSELTTVPSRTRIARGSTRGSGRGSGRGSARRAGRLPVTIRYGLPLAIGVALVWLGFSAWRAKIVTVVVVDPSGRPVEAAELEFFEFEDRPDSPSPTALCASHALAATEPVDLPRGLLSGDALVRIKAPGHGVGFGHVVPGKDCNVLEIGPPVAVRGRVTDRRRPIASTRVQAFGGGARGVLLGEAITDTDGRFDFPDISSSVAFVLLRAFHPGYGVAEKEWIVGEVESYDLQVEPTRAVEGLLASDGARELGGHVLRVFHLPGVTTVTDERGAFSLDHLPARLERAFLLVTSLPEHLTHRQAAITAGRTGIVVDIVPASVVRGRVVSGNSERGIAAARVHHEHGPRGREVVECDGSGHFEIGRVPPGTLELTAEVLLRREGQKAPSPLPPVPGAPPAARPRVELVQGSVSVDVERGRDLDGVVIRLY